MADPSGYHPRMDGRYFISFYEDDVQDVTPDEGPLDEYELAKKINIKDNIFHICAGSAAGREAVTEPQQQPAEERMPLH